MTDLKVQNPNKNPTYYGIFCSCRKGLA